MIKNQFAEGHLMKFVVIFLPLLLGCLAVGVESAPDTPTATDLEKTARSLAGEFAERLKPQLKTALQAGGPVYAIEVCSQQAPRIADALSAESGWLVRRVSLKSRNASRAVPDQWERKVLISFDQRQAKGEPVSGINHRENSPSRYRYMQAQGVEGVCLLCHGDNISAPVSAALHQYYPDDEATGYTLGQVRGAISLSKQL